MNIFSYLIFLSLHIFSAIFWIGGMLAYIFVFRPVLKNQSYANIKTNLFYELALQFRKVAYYLFAVSFLSGSAILYGRGYRPMDVLSLFQEPFSVIKLKILLFSILILSSIFHDFFLGPLTQKLVHENPRLWESYRSKAAFFGRMNLILSILIAVLGILFSRGQNSFSL
ncbi:hypothetical protein A0128_19815 [Leptospira tipperaryensis]|uniref:Copper resistance protein CopD n=1 Tax=Leptospira tipperaryensis TaxID=2564040 RepID=A0A1D7V383_9LEPT|nr:hypothetical protein [Leptospira tipperaryensis]AOP36276.1 hypothetical protein A0128_19815 [Leptospira tipperaryensis]